MLKNINGEKLLIGLSKNMKNKDIQILKLLKKYNKDKILKVIDIGAGSKPLENKVPKNMVYTSLDVDSNCKPDIVCDLDKKLPIKDKTYDFVICTEVLEHTLYPREIIKEIKRITKENGFIIITLPNEYNFYLRLKFLLGIQNNCEVPFREHLWENHIHKPRIQDLIKLYNECFEVKEIVYSWDSFSDKKYLRFIDKIIRIFLMPVSKNLFARSAIMIGKRK